MKPIHFGITVVVFLWGILPGWGKLAKVQEAQDILRKIDSVLTAPRDMTTREKMVLIDRDGNQKVREVKIYQKGSEWRLVRFLSPADVRGVGFLRLAADRLYLYLPAYRRVRRIASSVKNENFMGTDFTYEDLAQSDYAKDYQARLLSRDAERFMLELTPRPSADVSYGKLIVVADASNYMLHKIEFYDREGDLRKILQVDQIRNLKGYWVGKRMEMRDLKTGHRTVLELTEVRFDQGLSDNVFSERNLKRPE